MPTWFSRYLLPGLVLQSMLIGGGYGTGRELVEFFLQYGSLGGLLGLLIPTLIVITVSCMISFEFARTFRVYDYRSFFERLIGRGWIVYEISFLAYLILILAVIGSAAGNFLLETFGVRYDIGVVGLFLAVAFLVFKGTPTIEKFLAMWSLVLYAIYIVFFLWSFNEFGDQIVAVLNTGDVKKGWFNSGVRYASACAGAIPAMLFATRHIKSRREALWAGLLAGPVSIVPAILFYFVMMGHYPEIVERPVPANYILDILGSRLFQISFQVMLIGTLIETGSGYIHAFNERVANSLESGGNTLANWVRPVVAIFLLLVAAILSRFGIIDLIAKGYVAIAWVFVVVMVLPLITIGVFKLHRASSKLTA